MNPPPSPPISRGSHPSARFPEALEAFTSLYHDINQIQYSLRSLRKNHPSPLNRPPEERSLLKQVEEILKKKTSLEEQFGPLGLIPTPEIEGDRIACLVFGPSQPSQPIRQTSSSSALYQVPTPTLPPFPHDLPKIDS